MEAAKIWLVAIIAVLAYGIAHDLVTTRVSLEYFTIAKSGLYSTQSPTLLALLWGVGATWYIGVFVGGMLAFAARFGPRPRLAVPDLIRPAAFLLAAVGLSALGAGLAGYLLIRSGVVALTGDLAADISPSAHARFYAVVLAHWADYIVGFIGATLLAAWVWITRARAATATVSTLPSSHPRAKAA